MASGMIFCVDGGGTNTRAKIYSAGGAVLAKANAGPCNVSTDPVGSASNVTAVWRACAEVVGLDVERPAQVRGVIGSAGTLPLITREAFLSSIPQFADLDLVMDGHAAMIGAGEGKPCILLVAGTGAVGHGLYSDGRSIRRDGWGWIGGDRGGGVWLGRKAIRHAVDVSDGLHAPTALGQALLKAFEPKGGIASALVGIKPNEIASYAREVFNYAAEGDAYARMLVERSVLHFANLALQLDIEPGLPIFMAGGLAVEIAPRLAEQLRREILTPHQDALYGCYLIAAGAGPTCNIELSVCTDWGKK